MLETLACALVGHEVNDLILDEDPGARRCGCGERYLREDGALTRIRHTVACFARGHRFHRMAAREGFHEYGHTEYACHCGHPWLKPQAGAVEITHPPICTLAGHYIRFVCRRDGHAEYRCVACGHPFCFPVRGSE